MERMAIDWRKLLRCMLVEIGPKRQDKIDEALSAFGQLRNYAGSLLRTDLTRLTQQRHWPGT